MLTQFTISSLWPANLPTRIPQIRSKINSILFVSRLTNLIPNLKISVSWVDPNPKQTKLSTDSTSHPKLLTSTTKMVQTEFVLGNFSIEHTKQKEDAVGPPPTNSSLRALQDKSSLKASSLPNLTDPMFQHIKCLKSRSNNSKLISKILKFIAITDFNPLWIKAFPEICHLSHTGQIIPLTHLIKGSLNWLLQRRNPL